MALRLAGCKLQPGQPFSTAAAGALKADCFVAYALIYGGEPAVQPHPTNRALMAVDVQSMPRVSPPQRLLVVCELDDERRLEGVLQPLCEDEGHQVPQVQRLRRWTLQRVNMHMVVPPVAFAMVCTRSLVPSNMQILSLHKLQRPR